MLLHEKGLYKLTTFQHDTATVLAAIQLEASHDIFRGHFPGQPILPGVCMLQISQELLEKATGYKLLMSRTGQVKFLQPVDPSLKADLRISIRMKDFPENIQVSWTDTHDEVVLKYTADFKIV